MEKEVPRGRNTYVVIAVIVPVVVDIETGQIEATNVDTVAVWVYIIYLSSSLSLEIEVYDHNGLYPLIPVFYLRAVPQ